MTTAVHESENVSIREICEDLGKHPQVVYGYLRRNLIPHVRIQRTIVIRRAAYEKWLESGGTPHAA